MSGERRVRTRPSQRRSPYPYPVSERFATRCSPAAVACKLRNRPFARLPGSVRAARSIVSPTSTRGNIASRNAAFQNAVTPGVRRYRSSSMAIFCATSIAGSPARRARKHGARHTRAGASESTSALMTFAAILELGKAQSFEQSRLYVRVFRLADKLTGKPAPRRRAAAVSRSPPARRSLANLNHRLVRQLASKVATKAACNAFRPDRSMRVSATALALAVAIAGPGAATWVRGDDVTSAPRAGDDAARRAAARAAARRNTGAASRSRHDSASIRVAIAVAPLRSALTMPCGLP